MKSMNESNLLVFDLNVFLLWDPRGPADLGLDLGFRTPFRTDLGLDLDLGLGFDGIGNTPYAHNLISKPHSVPP